MSEFSEKLSYYISESGYKIYQIAREAAVDRTTLQKTMKGQRLPSMDYVKAICRILKISEEQEDDLCRLYHMEKLGRGMVESWQEIHRILIDIPKLRYKTSAENNPSFHLDKESFAWLNRNIITEFGSEIEVIQAVVCMMEQELTQEDSPEVFMDVSWVAEYALRHMAQVVDVKGCSCKCHQLVNLRSTDQNEEGLVDNFKILHQVLPYAFTLQENYDIRYIYTTGNTKDMKYILWPHYIVSHKHVMLCAQEPNRVILISNEQIAEQYRMEVMRMQKSYRPLFTYQGFSGEGIQAYRRMEHSSEEIMIYEDFPCPNLLVPKEVQEQLKQDPKIGDYARAYFVDHTAKGEKFIDYFGMKGMRNFIQTGHFPAIYDSYIPVVPVEQRKVMVANFYQELVEQTRHFQMINEKEFGYSGDFGVEICGRNQVLVYSSAADYPFGFITVDEPGICEAVACYFEHLKESKFLYSVEETIELYAKIVEDAFREIDGL